MLTGADLRGANLSGAYLYEANFRNADLTGADMLATYLAGVVNLTPEQLIQALNWREAIRGDKLIAETEKLAAEQKARKENSN